ncbi:hypothetical protein J6590_023846 [Homalodisca vitripennis]|nr:hypothetical protein J6590_023846 [Homalodisca vitripennis]
MASHDRNDVFVNSDDFAAYVVNVLDEVVMIEECDSEQDDMIRNPLVGFPLVENHHCVFKESFGGILLKRYLQPPKPGPQENVKFVPHRGKEVKQCTNVKSVMFHFIWEHVLRCFTPKPTSKDVEQQRTESILKRALDVEKGVSEKPPVTEEHPDGLDLSLFRDESQLKKSSKSRSRNSSKKSNSAKSDGAESAPDDDDDDEDDDEEEDDEEEAEDEEEEKKAKKETAPKTSKRKKKTAKKKPPSPEKKATAKTTSSGNKSTVQTSKKKTEARGNSKRKSSVSSNLQPAEKRARKSDTSSQSSERTNKTRSAEAVVGTKSRRDRRAQSRK